MPYLRPDADDLDGNWVDQAGGADLFAALDETVASDADFIRSVGNPSADISRVRLSDPTGGGVDTASPVTVRYRYRKQGAGTMNLTVRLKEGTTTRATWSHSGITESFITAAQVLSPGEKAAITDWTNLFLEFEAATADPALTKVAETVILDRVSTGNVQYTTGSFTPNSVGSDRLLVVLVGWFTSGTTAPFQQTLSYGGVPMNPIGVSSAGTFRSNMAMFYLRESEIPVGTNTFTWDGGGQTEGSIFMVAVEYVDAHQSMGMGAFHHRVAPTPYVFEGRDYTMISDKSALLYGYTARFVLSDMTSSPGTTIHKNVSAEPSGLFAHDFPNTIGNVVVGYTPIGGTGGPTMGIRNEIFDVSEILAPVFFKDDFNRADEALDVSADWTLHYSSNAGRMRVLSNELQIYVPTADTNFRSIYLLERALNPNQYAQVEFVSATAGSFSLVVRHNPSVTYGSYYSLLVTDTDVKLNKVLDDNNGNGVELVTAYTYTRQAGDRFRLEASGSSISGWLDTGNGFFRILRATDTDYASGKAGLHESVGGNADRIYLDNFEAGDLS